MPPTPVLQPSDVDKTDANKTDVDKTDVDKTDVDKTDVDKTVTWGKKLGIIDDRMMG